MFNLGNLGSKAFAAVFALAISTAFMATAIVPATPAGSALTGVLA